MERSLSQFTCISCRVAFATGEMQRDHYRSDWHRYNLKRKVASLPPLSVESFRERVLAQQAEAAEALAKQKPAKTKGPKLKAQPAATSIETVAKIATESATTVQPPLAEPANVNPIEAAMAEPTKAAEEEQEEEEHVSLEITDCIFCSQKSESLEDNLKHMTSTHSFFIPDIEYLINLQGLIAYLQEKVGDFFTCLQCNGKGRSLNSLKAVRNHMMDKGHVFIDNSEEGAMEISEYYDFSKSYPDWETTESSALVAYGDHSLVVDEGWQLKLPKGGVAVHRSLLRYTKQYFHTEDERESVLIQRMVDQYKAVGLPGYSPGEIEKRRDHAYISRKLAKQHMLVGIKGNKLQKHYREELLQ